MKILGAILSGSGATVLLAASAYAADLQGNEQPPSAPTNCYASFLTWLDSTTGDCPLSQGPLSVYGRIDTGATFQSNGAKFNPYYANGIRNIISKQSHGAKLQWSPNNLSQSNLGLALKQPLSGDINLIGDVDFGFDPYSLQFANGPASLYDNNKIPAYYQSAHSDSSRAGGIDNAYAYLGLSSPTYGELTVGRQNTLSSGLSSQYDPMGGSYAFSLLGFSAVAIAGAGATETARYNTSIEYVYDFQDVLHAGAIVQLGGYKQGNGANGAYQVDVGGEYAGFSVDAVYAYAKDAVTLSAYGGDNGAFGLPAGVATYDLKATLADLQAGILFVKYRWQALTFYGGYGYGTLSNPSDSYSWGLSNTLGGYAVLPGGVKNDAYTINKIQQVGWLGAKYLLRPDLDFAVAYYDQWYNNYSGDVCVANTVPVSGAPAGVKPQGLNTAANNAAGKVVNNCAGTRSMVGFLVDYRPWKRVDTYAGVTWSEVTGGAAAGYIKTSDTAVTAGVRVSF